MTDIPQPEPEQPILNPMGHMVVTGDAEIIRCGEVVTDTSDEETR